jgi:serine/threonine-protein kinase
LAVILYEVLTGKLPFEAKNPMEYIQLHVMSKPKPINERVPGKTFPPLLWTVLEKAMEKKPEDRFGSAAEFAHALQAVLDGRTELPSFASNGQPRPAIAAGPSASGHPPAANAQATTIPQPVRSSPLPLLGRHKSAKPSVGLLVGVAAAFLLVGALLAALIMRLVLSH